MADKAVTITDDFWHNLRRYTTARIALGRAGHSLPTAAQLQFQLAHARAKDSIYAAMEQEQLQQQLADKGLETLLLQSQVPDRDTYLLRPDLGRKLNDASAQLLQQKAKPSDICFIIADGLSSWAVNTHAVPLLQELLPALQNYQLAPVSLVSQARVAVSDEIGHHLQAKLAVILIGERPGLSAPDSLGIYMTYAPRPGLTDERRNCISNVRPQGLSYAHAAKKLLNLIQQAFARQLSGVQLKDDLDLRLPE